MLILFATKFFKSMYGVPYFFKKLKPSKKKHLETIFCSQYLFFLIARCFSSFFTKVLKDVGYDLIYSSSPFFISTILFAASSFN